MSQGIPLVDEDRYPWLEIIRTRAENAIARHVQSDGPHKGVVIACSALRKSYRDILRQPPRANMAQQQLRCVFVYISGTREVLLDRMSKRANHFMKSSMLDSQLATLEVPIDEPDVVTVDLQKTTEEQVEITLQGMKDLVIRVDVEKPSSS